MDNSTFLSVKLSPLGILGVTPPRVSFGLYLGMSMYIIWMLLITDIRNTRVVEPAVYTWKVWLSTFPTCITTASR